MDMANLFVGDDDPSNSLFHVIKNIKFPSLEETTKEHMGGGAVVGLEIGMRSIKPVNLTFQVEGMAPDTSARFMPANPARIKYTVRGNMRDLKTHEDLEVRAIVEGRMTKVEYSEFDRDKGMTTDYEIKEVFFYSLHIGGIERLYFDYWAGPSGIRIDGATRYQAVARNLGLA